MEILSLSGDTISFNKMKSINAESFKLLHKNTCIFIWLEIWNNAVPKQQLIKNESVWSLLYVQRLKNVQKKKQIEVK